VITETTMAYEKVADEIAELRPETIVISSPHSVMYADYFHISPGAHASGDFGAFGAPKVSFDVDYDERFAIQWANHAAVNDIDAGILGERDKRLDHGTMVPLYFIMKKYTDFKLVRIGLSGFSLPEHYRMGMLCQRVADELDRRTVYIGSGDLSHKLKEDGPYGFDPSGPVYDDRIMDVMGRGAFDELMDFDETLCDRAAECGHRSFVMLAGALDKKNISIEKLSHQDVTGVGYGICTYHVTGESDDRAFLDKWQAGEDARRQAIREKEDIYVRLARRTIESYIRTGKQINWFDVKDDILRGLEVSATDGTGTESGSDTGSSRRRSDEKAISELEDKHAGAFVSIHKEGRLRGCIGTISATKDRVADEIIENAISASVRDPRFDPIEEDELDRLEISVDILSDAEEISSVDQLDPKRYGVIVTKGMRRGLLLPDLDGVDTVEEQLSIAKRKAGLSGDEKGCTVERFEVVRHF
ncbi:MAG: AmmeMemoRadiSam system protein A, partial [Eubacterium sp.]|nr:AmmeMemoRadiSam system protein A [Eubacterium sp.]